MWDAREGSLGAGVDIAGVLAWGFEQLWSALRRISARCECVVMARPSHPKRTRAVQLMRRGLASPLEIARASGLSVDTVMSWRQRAGIRTEDARIAHVRKLMERQPKPVPVIDDPDAAPY